jgi:hypothetical protein
MSWLQSSFIKNGVMEKEFLVEALHDYVAPEGDRLSFKKGDVVRVLHTDASGWWDGMCGERRGWFPSNYVKGPRVESVVMFAFAFVACCLTNCRLSNQRCLQIMQASTPLHSHSTLTSSTRYVASTKVFKLTRTIAEKCT